jgi:CheY-like chemotaxis protein
MKILIADDEDVIRTTLEAILKKGGGFETDIALDGAEAVKKIEANVYDLVLLDLEMPRVSGYDVLARVRVLYPHLPVFFITGKADAKKVMASIAQHGLNGFIEKPFTPDKVLEIVNKALAKKSGA